MMMPPWMTQMMGSPVMYSPMMGSPWGLNQMSMNSPYDNNRYQTEWFNNDSPRHVAKAQQNSGKYQEYFSNDQPSTKRQYSEARSEAPSTPANTENPTTNM